MTSGIILDAHANPALNRTRDEAARWLADALGFSDAVTTEYNHQLEKKRSAIVTNKTRNLVVLSLAAAGGAKVCC